jgi:mono/diheme cytochrome c family protein
MKSFVAGVVVSLVCILAGVYAFFAGGLAPVATAARPMPFERKLAHMALDARLQKEMPRSVPIEANQCNYIAGAHEYLINCAVCHGVPGKEKTAIANGEFPKPPS